MIFCTVFVNVNLLSTYTLPEIHHNQNRRTEVVFGKDVCDGSNGYVAEPHPRQESLGGHYLPSHV